MDPSGPSPAQSITPKTLTLIRGAMLGGVLVLGLVFWFLGRSRHQAPPAPDVMRALGYAWYALILVAAGGVVALRKAQAGRKTFEERARLSIVGGALSEASALLGGVYFLLTGDPLLYALGVVALGASFRLLDPGRPEEER